jgi:F-type H+-transporting ATPase subunit c
MKSTEKLTNYAVSVQSISSDCSVFKISFRRINYMDPEVAAILVSGLRYLGAGLAMIGTLGAGLGIGILGSGAMQGIARNPDAAGAIQINMILAIAFAEAVAIYALVVALVILFVG